MQNLSRLTESLITPAMRKRGYALAKIIANWPDIAGEAADWCIPVNISYVENSQRSATLTLSVVSGRGPQLQALSAAIIESINSLYGYAAIARIKLKQDLVYTPKDTTLETTSQSLEANISLGELEKATARIQSPEIRAALIRLGQAIK